MTLFAFQFDKHKFEEHEDDLKLLSQSFTDLQLDRVNAKASRDATIEFIKLLESHTPLKIILSNMKEFKKFIEKDLQRIEENISQVKEDFKKYDVEELK